MADSEVWCVPLRAESVIAMVIFWSHNNWGFHSFTWKLTCHPQKGIVSLSTDEGDATRSFLGGYFRCF